MGRYLLSVTICCIFGLGCKDNPSGNDFNKGIALIVDTPAGSLYEDLPYLPLLGNLSYLGENKTEILTLSKPVAQGEKIYIEPVAFLEYKSNGQNNYVIIAVPTNKDLISIDVVDLVDLSVKFSSVKRIIEQWYSSYNGLGKNQVVKWGNKSEALKMIQSSLAEDK